MMKMNSIIHSYLLPLAPPPHRAAPGFAVPLRTLANLSAKKPSLGTSSPGRVCDLSAKTGPVDNFYSASILQTAEKRGNVDKVCKCLILLNIPVNVRKLFIYATRYNGYYVK
jgi:hypothetical protein